MAWRWPTADRALQASNPAWRGGRYEDTPLMVNGLLYTVTPLGLIVALDPATGETAWVYDPEVVHVWATGQCRISTPGPRVLDRWHRGAPDPRRQ